MDALHHPALQVFHWTCALAMVGMALDPTGVGATISNYLGHIGGGLGDLFGAATGGGAATSAHAAHSTAAGATAATTTGSATVGVHASHAAHAAHSTAISVAPSGIESSMHAHHDFSEAAAATATHEAAGHVFATRGEWFASLPAATQTQMQEAASLFGMSLEKYTEGFCGVGIPDNWGPM